MAETKLTPLKAIRAKCLDCCCQQASEVRICTITECPLHPYRMGRNPSRAGIGKRDFGNKVRMQNDVIEQGNYSADEE